ncbi:MAG TPA: SGNH/GDSL hydrolase family protein [Acidimicrobiales bacterium]|nr:SGNH/GDSL hydrolase family protein [Acidimicrobiales bacterium]
MAAAAAVLAAGVFAVAGHAGGPLRYVALGDSYTAGPSIPNQQGDPPGCRRSDRNYPHLVAAALGAELRDVSCSGATTTDLRFAQKVSGGANPPQLDALDAGTDVVTLGIGGNDIGFGEIVTQCLSLQPLGHPCQDRFAGPAGDEVSRRIASAALRVSGALEEIRRRAPAARVFVVGYPAILPPYGAGCWPVMPFTFDDALYLRAKEQELDAMLAGQAAAGGATYVDVYGPTEGHDACQPPTVRWVEPVVPVAAADPVHPNSLGMRAMATAVATAVAGRSVTLPADPGITVKVGGP